jgi:hypothetical protein
VISGLDNIILKTPSLSLSPDNLLRVNNVVESEYQTVWSPPLSSSKADYQPSDITSGFAVPLETGDERKTEREEIEEIKEEQIECSEPMVTK